MSIDYKTAVPVPRWVKAFALAAVVLGLLIGLVIVTGIGGPHGPGRHMPEMNDAPRATDR